MRLRRIFVVTALVAGSVLSVSLSPVAPVSAACARTHVLRKGENPWKVAEIVKRSTTTKKSVTTISKEIQGINRNSRWRIGDRVCLPSWARVATPPTSVAPKVPAVSADAAKTVIREVFAGHPSMVRWVAIQVARHESGLNNRAVNRSGCCVGLFQINYDAHHAWLRTNLGVTTKEGIKDPRLNARAALSMYGSGKHGYRNNWCKWDTIVRKKVATDVRRFFPQQTPAAMNQLLFDVGLTLRKDGSIDCSDPRA
jgi:hypothetical protein